MKNLFTNYKTSSAAVLGAVATIVHLIFLVVKKQPITETDVVVTFGALLFVYGAFSSADAATVAKVQTQVNSNSDKLDQVSGDTKCLKKQINHEEAEAQ